MSKKDDGVEDTVNAVALVLEERLRQTNEKHWTTENDDQYVASELAQAAAAYCVNKTVKGWMVSRLFWPWDQEHWKPRNHKKNIIRAGALILAELERLERLERKEKSSGESYDTG